MNPIALVTGGGRGIGAATCRLFAANGYDVCVNYARDHEAAECVVDECRAFGVRAIPVLALVEDSSAVKAMFARCVAELGKPSVLVNNAGVTGGATRLADLSDDALRRTFRTNVDGTIYCIREAIPLMSTKSGNAGGVIVNLSSIAATLGSPNEYVHYAASKAAVETLTIGLSKELGPEGIRVNAIQAGTTRTDIHARGGNADRPDKIAKTAPLGRAGEPEDMAEAIYWLASDKSSYATGAILRIGGGV